MRTFNETNTCEQEYLKQLHQLDAFVRKSADKLALFRENRDIRAMNSLAKKLEIANSLLEDETPVFLDQAMTREEIDLWQDPDGFSRGIIEVSEQELTAADELFRLIERRLFGDVEMTDTGYTIVGAMNDKLYLKVESIPDDIDCN